MPVTVNTPYTAANAAVASWCALNDFAPRAEFLSQGENTTPERFVLWRIDSEEFIRFADNVPPAVRYVFSFYIGLTDTPSNRAALYGYHWGVCTALRAAGFIPQNGYELGIDKEMGRVYVSKEYTLTINVGDIVT